MTTKPLVSLSEAARRTGLAASGREMRSTCARNGVSVEGAHVDLGAFRGAPQDIDLELTFVRVSPAE